MIPYIRNWIKIPKPPGKDCAIIIAGTIRKTRKTGYVWYRTMDRRFRIAGEDYSGDDGWILMGAYTAKARTGHIRDDITAIIANG